MKLTWSRKNQEAYITTSRSIKEETDGSWSIKNSEEIYSKKIKSRLGNPKNLPPNKLH